MVENYGDNTGESPPNSGMPPQTPSPAPPPAQPYQQQYAAPPAPMPPKKNIFESIASGGTLSTIIVIAILLMMVGIVLVHAAPSVTNYGSADPSYEKRQDDSALEKSMQIWGQVLMDLGVASLSAFFLIGSIARKELDLKIRAGMFTLAAILIIVTWIRMLP